MSRRPRRCDAVPRWRLWPKFRQGELAVRRRLGRGARPPPPRRAPPAPKAPRRYRKTQIDNPLKAVEAAISNLVKLNDVLARKAVRAHVMRKRIALANT